MPGSVLALSSLQTLCLDEQSSPGTENSVLLWVSLFNTVVIFHQAEKKPKFFCCQHRQHRLNDALYTCAHMHLWVKFQSPAVEPGKSSLGWGAATLHWVPKFPIPNFCIKLKRLEKLSSVTSTEKKKTGSKFSLCLFIFGQSIWQCFLTLESFKNGSTDFTQTSNVITFGLRSSVEN